MKNSIPGSILILTLSCSLFIIGCGDFVRDPSVRNNSDINRQDAQADSYSISDASYDFVEIKDEEIIDIESYAEEPDTVDEINSDIYVDSDSQEDIEWVSDDTTYDFIYYDDATDTINDESITDISDIIGPDTSDVCDCDAGYSCGKCYYPGTDGLSNKALKDRLYQLIKDHNSLGYDKARVKMFSEIDNFDGWVECVYTGFKLQTSGVPDSNIMNTEHTWPQSMGADSEPARSDLFHLFPTKSDANSRRGSYPFGTVVNITWSEGGSKLGTNSKGQTVFEPRDVHKGNVARAMFYFSVRYKLPIDTDQENELRKWHIQDPVDQNEIDRCNKINVYQNNRNPFVDWPEFVERIDDF